MKKQTVILLLTMSIVLSGQKINVAMEAGLGISNVHTNETTGLSNLFGFNAGILMRFPFNNKLWFQTGLSDSPRGAQKTVKKENSTINTRRVVNYLKLPVNLVYYFRGEKNGGLFVSPGIYTALATDGYTLKTITGTNKDVQSYRKEIVFGNNNNQVRSLDYGISVGLGYQSPLGMYIKGQYELGLKNVVNTKYVYNRSLQLMIGYIIKPRPTN